MAHKVLLRVRVPATQHEHEFRVCADLTVGQATELIGTLLRERERGQLIVNGSEELMLLDGLKRGHLLDPQVSIQSLMWADLLVDGSMVALV